MRPTTSRILIDTNIPVYAAGRPHALRAPARFVLELAARKSSAFFTDAEVLQELLHRYLALRMWDRFRSRFDAFAALMSGRVEPVLADDVQGAGALADRYQRLSARDLVHIAVMQRVGSTRIVSADAGFDLVAEIERLDPAHVDEWAPTVATAG